MSGRGPTPMLALSRGDGRSAAAPFVAFVVVVALVVVGIPGLLAGGPPRPTRLVPERFGPDAGAPVNENLSLPLPNPSAPGPNGTRTALTGNVSDVLTITVDVSLGTFNTSWGVYQVHMPSLSVRFPVSGSADSQFPVLVAPKNLTYPQNGTTAYQTTILLNQVAAFRPGLNATLTSNGYAPSASLPWGAVALNVSWSYALKSSSGTVRASAGPGTPQSVFPAQSFGLAYAGPATVLLGTQYTVCLTGPVVNRTFGLRGVNATGVQFANVSSIFPPGTTGCLEVPVPTNVTGGKIIVQLWEYTTEPIRLRPLPATTTSGPVAGIAGVVEPRNATTLITVDGFPVVATADGNYSIGFAPGAHRVFFNASGYWAQAATVNVSAGTTDWLNITLLPRSQQPQQFGTPPLLNLTPLQAATVFGAVLLVAVLAAYAIYQRRRPPPTSPPSPGSTPQDDRGR